jgi:ESS family glutamate:Na+ symporter
MTSALLTELLRSSALLAFFLLAGTFLRAKVKVFQKMLLPASVIGGFLAMLIGPRIWGDFSPLVIVFGLTDDWINTWSLLPGILIVPIFASIPLGMFSNNKKESTVTLDRKANTGFVLVSCGLFTAVTMLQGIIGFGTNLAYSAIRPGTLYRTFGYELPSGFAGGHGTAGAVGKLLEGFGMEYWETAQGVTTTTATIGLIGGMAMGIIIINIAARKGKTAVLKNPQELPLTLKKGYTKDIHLQESVGRQTTMSSSIESISLHLSLILVAVGLGYYLRLSLLGLGLAPFGALPVWFYAMFAMFIVDYLIAKLKLSWMIDNRLKSRIVGTISDFAIVSAIASIPVQAVLEYIVPIVIMSIVGFLITYLFVFKLYGWFYKDNAPFEHAIIAWGTGTGVMINGLMLLKICDPDYETPAMMNFSLGFSLMGMLNIPISLWAYTVLRSGSTFENFMVQLVLFFAFLAMSFVGRRLTQVKKPGFASADYD